MENNNKYEFNESENYILKDLVLYFKLAAVILILYSVLTYQSNSISIMFKTAEIIAAVSFYLAVTHINKVITTTGDDIQHLIEGLKKTTNSLKIFALMYGILTVLIILIKFSIL